MKVNIILYLYLLVGGLNLIAQALHNAEMEEYTKPLLMPLLIYYVYYTAGGRVTIQRLLVAGALVFSWIGDLLLLYPETSWSFLGGLGSFLVAQLIYTIALSKSVYQKIDYKLKPLIPILLYGTALLVFLIPRSGDLKIPVLLYALCILAMVSSARLRLGWTTKESFNWSLAGAMLFVISDSLIAINRFAVELPQAGFLVMLTYISAQYLLVRGILSHPG